MEKSAPNPDIVIAGGGIAGMTAAVAFGTLGKHVICVDPSREFDDSRTTAFMQPSKMLLERAGVWEGLAAQAAPLQIMRIMDAGGEAGIARIVKDFDAAEISDQPFGWNLPNRLIRAALVARISALPNVTLLRGVAVRSVLTRETEVLVSLSDQTRLRGGLLLAADGRGSTIREALGIGVKTTRYGQQALTFTVTHPQPHKNVSTEIHRSGGPFTLVPLPGVDGKHASAVVWMERSAEAQRLCSLPRPDFEAEINLRSCRCLGELTLASEVGSWPMISQIADRLSGERTALIAEAAHVVPPIGAQGLNMSLGDINLLIDLSGQHPLGSKDMLTAYNQRRLPELRLRVAGIGMLNRSSMMGTPAIRDARARVLETLYAMTPVRRALMKAGVGI